MTSGSHLVHSAALMHGLMTAFAVLFFRALPFVAWVISHQVARRRAVGITLLTASYVVGALLLDRVGLRVARVLLCGVAALLYYALSTVVVVEVIQNRHRFRRTLAAVLAAALLLGLPTVLLATDLRAALVLIGFEMGLGCYSYAIDGNLEGDRPRDALFSVLVDPTLVYGDRAVPSARATLLRGSLRMRLGVLIMTGQTLVLACLGLMTLTAPWELVAFSTPGGAAQFALVSAMTALGLYCAHAGLAGMRIGLMHLGGFQTREAYVRPFLAASPTDFWRRWNTWLGAWARRYVFLPVALGLGRHLPRALRPLALAAAVLAAFGTIGAFHDVLALAMSPHPGTRDAWVMTAVFLLAGIVLLAWELGRRALKPLTVRWPRAARRSGGRLLFVPMMVLFVWIAVPALSTGKPPLSIRHATRSSAMSSTPSARLGRHP